LADIEPNEVHQPIEGKSLSVRTRTALFAKSGQSESGDEPSSAAIDGHLLLPKHHKKLWPIAGSCPEGSSLEIAAPAAGFFLKAQEPRR
jgi:hypothetical protein